MPNDGLTIKQRVRIWLVANNKTQAWLAQRARITAPFLSEVLDGYRSPSDKVAERIERITGVDVRPETAEVRS